ncbi:MAG TPA: polysaccharide biosynthesis tyrosine autokinase [Pseudacidobacterium sp.]|nr:polysaccharide biosynthesis tyrosine autokinase [Pseudacidobacterium sp.]
MDTGRLLERPPDRTRDDSFQLANLQEMYGPSVREQSLGDYGRILLKHKWTVIVTAVVVLIVAALISIRMTPIYEAITRIMVSPPTSSPLDSKNTSVSPMYYQDLGQYINTQVRVLQSDSTAELVIHQLNLDTRPEFAGNARTQSSGGITVSESPAQEDAHQIQLIRRLQESLKVQPVPDTSIVEIRYSDPNPSLAAEIANSAAATFIEQNLKARYTSTTQAADWLSKQLADLEIKMESSQAKLLQYQKEHNIVGADDKQNLTTEKLEAISKELITAQADRIQKESLYQMATTSSPETLSSVLQDPVLSGLRQQQMQLQAQYALLSTQFSLGYPRVLEIKNQLDQVDQSYREQVRNTVARIKNDYETAATRERMLQAALNEQTGIEEQLSQNAIEYRVLKQEADSNRQLYDGLLQQLKEASLAAGLNSSNIRVVDQARAPLRPVSPNIPRNLEFALLIGLIGGAALAFGLEALDTTVRTPEQAESISGLPTLAVIPLQSASGHVVTGIARTRLLKKASLNTVQALPLISHQEPKSEIAEAYRALRTSVLLSSASHPPRSILVTSPTPQDGKTTTSLNIAIVLAQQGKRVLLLDADMRRPSIHLAFGLKDKLGLSNILVGSATISDVLQCTVQPNLFVIPAGPVPPHPSELLSSSSMQDLLLKLREEFDHIIVDSPPIISVTDAVLLSAQMDTVLLVIRSGQTTAAHVRRARNLLQSANAGVLGLVVNAADLGSPDYYYYHYEAKYRSYSGKEENERNSTLNDNQDLDNIADQRER